MTMATTRAPPVAMGDPPIAIQNIAAADFMRARSHYLVVVVDPKS